MESSQIATLIRPAIQAGSFIWADFGSGQGAFTLALRELGGPEIEIYSVDQNAQDLKKQQHSFEEAFPGSKIHYIESDFTKPLSLPPWDGILMANSLHFVKNQAAFLAQARSDLKPGGKLLVVEYDTDRGNPFVPHPLSFGTFQKLAVAQGFQKPKRLATGPSQYWNQMYSALATKA